jgi:hypothetical protein
VTTCDAGCEGDVGDAACTETCDDECVLDDYPACNDDETKLLTCAFDSAAGCNKLTEVACAEGCNPDADPAPACNPDCVDACVLDDYPACNDDNTMVITCAMNDVTGCTEMGETDCDADGLVCEGAAGAAVCACTNECDPANFPKCQDDQQGIETCVAQDDGCYDLVVTDCGTNMHCALDPDNNDAPTCMDDCVDACAVADYPMCNEDGTAIVTCVDEDSDGCLDKVESACEEPSPACELVDEAPTCVCVDECVAEEYPMCGEDGISVETCVVNDTDSCTDIVSTPCETDDVCNTETAMCECVDKCDPDMPFPGCSADGMGLEFCRLQDTGCYDIEMRDCGEGFECTGEDGAAYCYEPCVSECDPDTDVAACADPAVGIVTCEMHDADGCYYFVTTECGDGESCVLVDDVPTCDSGAGCVDECEDGSLICDPNSTGMLTCIEGTDGCNDLSLIPCGDARACDDTSGSPLCECIDPCDPEAGYPMCTEDGLGVIDCVENNAECFVLEEQMCGNGDICDTEDPGCICVDECTMDEVACSEDGQNVVTCVVSDVDACTDWVMTEECGMDRHCELVEDAPACVDGCSNVCTEGESMCMMMDEQMGIATCVMQENDCTDYDFVACGAGEFCDDSEGAPVCTCVDQCTLNEPPVCLDEDTRMFCGIAPSGCLDILEADCPDNQLCENGMCGCENPCDAEQADMCSEDELGILSCLLDDNGCSYYALTACGEQEYCSDNGFFVSCMGCEEPCDPDTFEHTCATGIFTHCEETPAGCATIMYDQCSGAQACNDETQMCECIDDCEIGTTWCSDEDTFSRYECLADEATGCPVETLSICGGDLDECDPETGECVACYNHCDPEMGPMCDEDGNLNLCVMGDEGCYVYEVTVCADNQICDVDAAECVCDDQCSMDDTYPMCNLDGLGIFTECNEDGNGCMVVTEIICAPGEVCNPETIVCEPCEDACTIGDAPICDENGHGLVSCIEGPAGCTIWGDYIPCGGGEICNSETTECVPGECADLLVQLPVPPSVSLVQQFTDTDSVVYSTYIADDINNEEMWFISQVYVAGGFWNGEVSNLSDVTAMNFAICPDHNGRPDCDPETLENAFWSMILSPDDESITILDDVEPERFGTAIVRLPEDVILPPGSWWFMYYVTMPFVDESGAQFGLHGIYPAANDESMTGLWINPGGGFDMGTDWITLTEAFPTSPMNQNISMAFHTGTCTDNCIDKCGFEGEMGCMEGLMVACEIGPAGCLQWGEPTLPTQCQGTDLLVGCDPDNQYFEMACENGCGMISQEIDWCFDAPAEGNLIITEVMVDPAAVDDVAGEWFEVINLSDNPVNLNGLSIVEDNSWTIDTDIVLESGWAIVFANNDDPTTNGGIENTHLLNNLAFGNAGDDLALMFADAIVDEISFNETDYPYSSGVAMQLSVGRMDPILNDDPANWCAAPFQWAEGSDYGTPYGYNLACFVLYENDLETDPDLSMMGDWQWGTPDPAVEGGPAACASGAGCLGTNLDQLNNQDPPNLGYYSVDYSFDMNYVEMSLDLTETIAPILVFDMWLKTEGNSWDWATVLVSSDGGEEWNVVEMINPTFNDVLGVAWTGDFGDEWFEASGLLWDYAGQSVLVRFVLDSDFSITAPGFYVDNIKVVE